MNVHRREKNHSTFFFLFVVIMSRALRTLMSNYASGLLPEMEGLLYQCSFFIESPTLAAHR